MDSKSFFFIALLINVSIYSMDKSGFSFDHTKNASSLARRGRDSLFIIFKQTHIDDFNIQSIDQITKDSLRDEILNLKAIIGTIYTKIAHAAKNKSKDQLLCYSHAEFTLANRAGNLFNEENFNEIAMNVQRRIYFTLKDEIDAHCLQSIESMYSAKAFALKPG